MTSKGSKHERSAAVDVVKDDAKAHFADAFAKLPPDEAKAKMRYAMSVFGDLKKEAERSAILKGTRTDGRGHEDIRPISCEVGVLPRAHGSAVFTRGETQALVVATLGTIDDEQIVDGLSDEVRKKFYLHYNFPPFSVGETRPIRGPGRREIGHGCLAERSVEVLLPDHDEFPYTIRLVSEILESNGSSSMASVCGSTLALMDAGVPIRQPIAGIAMGLVKEGRKTAILSDIQGSEDHCGDMDFKVSGTQYGITALQMDIKCKGLTRKLLEKALEQAKAGRIHILKEMLGSLRRPRKELSRFAPRLIRLKIDPEKIGIVIGPSGKHIRGLQEETKTKINIDDDGTVTIAGADAPLVEQAVNKIESMTAEVEVGRTYKGKVVSIKEFGAFVEILPGQEGLLHVSEISDEFVRSVADEVAIGDEIDVKVLDVDPLGKIKLSRKALSEGGDSGKSRLRSRGDDDRPKRRPRRDEEDERPRSRRRPRGDEDEDDRPRRRPRRDDEDEDRPRRRPRRDDDDEAPRPRRGRGASKDDDEDRPRRRPRRDDDDEAPRPRRRPRRDDEDEDAPRPRRRASARDDEDDRPRRRRPSKDDEDDRPRRRASRDDEDETRPRRRPRRDDEDDEAPRPRRRRASAKDEDDERPRRRPRRDDEDEDRPRRRPRRDDDDEAPRPRRGRGASKDDDEERPRRRPRRDDDDEAPRPRRGRGAAKDDDDDRPRRRTRRDSEDDERPRRRRASAAAADDDDRPRRSAAKKSDGDDDPWAVGDDERPRRARKGRR